MRYVLYPGYVISANDGQRHFINGFKLTKLYGIEVLYTTEYVVFGDMPHYREQPGDIPLFPMSNGNYTLPKAKNE